MAREEGYSKLKKKYLKRAQQLVSLKADAESRPKRKLQASVEPYCVHGQDFTSGAMKQGWYVPDSCGTDHQLSDVTARHDAEVSELKSMLKVQMNVNKELKRLLIASVGSDLQRRLEQLVHEKAELSCELDSSLEQLVASGEEVNNVSIECDIWRSKFLASRLMIDELASWKAELTLQYRQSQQALQCMMQEREQLSKTLVPAVAQLHKALDASLPGVLSGHVTQPSTILELGHTVDTISKSLHFQATSEHKPGADCVKVCEPTMGEILARQALSSQCKKSQERKHPAQLKSDIIIHHQLVPTRPLSHNTIKYLLPDDHIDIPFCCKCKGRVIVV